MPCIRPQDFPELPPRPENLPGWPASVNKAYLIVEDAYNKASQLLRQEESEPLRLRTHSKRLLKRMFPLVKAMGKQVPSDWALSRAENVAQLIAELEAAADNADAVCVKYDS